MDVAFIKHAQHDIDRRNGGQNQNHLRIHRLLEHLRGTGKTAAYRGRHAKLGHRTVDCIAGLREGRTGWQVKGDGRCRRKALVVHRQRRVRRLPAGKVRERDRLTVVINHKHVVQRADVLGVTRVHLHHHLVLVHGLVDGGNLTLAEGIVQQAVGGIDVNPQT